MPPVLDASQMQIVLGDYCVGKSRCLADPFVLVKAQGYRRNLGARMVALDKTMMHDRLPAAEAFVSRKVDGECTFLLIDQGQACTVNPGGVVRTGLGFMQDAVELLSKTKHKQMLVAGELYVDKTAHAKAGKSGGRERVHDVSRVARQPQNQSEVDSLRFAVFDILEVDGKPTLPAYAAVYKQIETTFKGRKRIHPVETLRTKTLEEATKAYEQWVEGDGAEGIVVRSDSAGMFKVKPRLTIDAAVLGYTEGSEDRAGLLHDVLLGLMRQDQTFHVLGRVGGGFTDDQRRDWLSDLKDMAVESDYAEVNDAVAYQMVRPEWVVEVSVLDLINQNSRGLSIDRMVLDFDKASGGYRSVRRMPLASPISPVFVRRREDKSIRVDDLRLEQVADVVEVPNAHRDAKQFELPKSQILRREVYTKTLKGATMVRKLLLWQTNKTIEGVPAFVAYFTDFSPNRATPLERDIRVSNSREQIEALFQEFKDENIVKGWAPVP